MHSTLAFAQSIQDNNTTVEEDWKRLQEIQAFPDEFGNAVQIVLYGIVGSCVAVLVDGNSTVIASAGVIGLIVEILVLFLSNLQFPLHLTNVIAGIFSRLLLRRLGFPAAVMLMPAIVLLVPELHGFTGMAHIMLHEDLPSRIRLLTTMLLTAVAIAAGQLVTNINGSAGVQRSLRDNRTNETD